MILVYYLLSIINSCPGDELIAQGTILPPTRSVKCLRSFIQRGTSENPLLHHRRWSRWRARQRVRSHAVFASDVIVGGDADGDDANGVDGGAG